MVPLNLVEIFHSQLPSSIQTTTLQTLLLQLSHWNILMVFPPLLWLFCLLPSTLKPDSTFNTIKCYRSSRLSFKSWPIYILNPQPLPTASYTQIKLDKKNQIKLDKILYSDKIKHFYISSLDLSSEHSSAYLIFPLNGSKVP